MENVPRKIKQTIDNFDTTGYPWPNQYRIQSRNKNVLDRMKDELKGILRSRCFNCKQKLTQ